MQQTPSHATPNKYHLLSTGFTFHEDPGHGWLQVPYSDLVILGLTEKISTFSYRNGMVTYLEEDCDMALFITAYNAAILVSSNPKHGTYRIRDKYHSQCFIRNLPNYYIDPL